LPIRTIRAFVAIVITVYSRASGLTTTNPQAGSGAPSTGRHGTPADACSCLRHGRCATIESSSAEGHALRSSAVVKVLRR
jgi:hypothetical protein